MSAPKTWADLGIPYKIIRSGPKRHLSKRERRWEREKTHRRRRHRWSRWPKVPFSTHFYVLNMDHPTIKDIYNPEKNWQWTE